MHDELNERIRHIYQAHYKDVYSFLLYFTNNQNETEDLTQEVFTSLLRSLPSYDGRVVIKTWLFSIAKYIAIDYYRKQKLKLFFSEKLLRNIVTTEGVPEAELAHKEELVELKKALQKLKPSYRMVIILRSIKGYSIKETAELLAISEAKVKVDYHRGLKQLQRNMTEPKEGGWQNEFV